MFVRWEWNEGEGEEEEEDVSHGPEWLTMSHPDPTRRPADPSSLV